MSRPSSKGPRAPRGRTALREAETGSSAEDAAATPELPSAAHGVALLRIALALKKPDGPGIDEAIRQVATRMSLDEHALRAWIAANTGLLRTVSSGRPQLKLHPMD